MGWLRQLMNDAQIPVRSFDRLAGRILEHSDWPTDSRPQPRSFGALLSKMDRGVELDWLGDRPVVQHIAAEVLGCPLSSIQAALGKQVTAADRQQRRFRFDDVRFARPLELLEEALPPGFPTQVMRPAAWDWTWWQAPAGSGRSMVGQWLQARGLARFVVVDTAEQIAPLLDAASEPLFIELLGNADQLAIARVGSGHCCVAGEASRHDGWQVVHSPGTDDYLRDLMLWLAPRLPKDGQFDLEKGLHWLHEAAQPTISDRFGVALGLAGLIDEFGVEKLAKKSLDQVAAAFVREKLRSALSGGGQESGWLVEHGFEALVGMVRRGLLLRGQGSSRTESQWIELVPEEHQQGLDKDWARLALSKAVSRSAAKEIEAALSKLQPGAFRIVRALRNAGLLRADEPSDRLQLGPHWLERVIEAEALRQICTGSPFEWGEGLLLPDRAPQIFARLCTQFMTEDFSALDTVLELDAANSPAHAAATEACYCALGFALCEGASVPSDLVLSLYEEQRDLIVEIDKQQLPSPRIVHGGQGKLSVAGFHLATLAISAELPTRGTPKHPVLHPWAERTIDPRMPQMLTRIAEWLNQPGHDRWRAGACLLVDRLARHFSETMAFRVENGDPHELEWPSLILREAQSGSLGEAWLDRILRRPGAIDNLHAMATKKSDVWPKMAARLWESWQRAHMPGDALRMFSAHSAWFWPWAPTGCLIPALLCASRMKLAVRYELLSPEQWQYLQDALPDSDAVDSSCLAESELWRHAPLDTSWHWMSHARSEAPWFRAVQILWERDPTQAIAHYERKLNPRLWPKLILLTPHNHGPALLPWLIKAVSKPGAPVALVDAARRWLHEHIAQRGLAVREAYTLLSELEQRASRVSL